MGNFLYKLVQRGPSLGAVSHETFQNLNFLLIETISNSRRWGMSAQEKRIELTWSVALRTDGPISTFIASVDCSIAAIQERCFKFTSLVLCYLLLNMQLMIPSTVSIIQWPQFRARGSGKAGSRAPFLIHRPDPFNASSSNQAPCVIFLTYPHSSIHMIVLRLPVFKLFQIVKNQSKYQA